MARQRMAPGEALMEAGIRPVPPGVFLARRVLEPRHLAPEAAAKAMGLEFSLLLGVLAQHLPVDDHIAGCLAKFTGTTQSFWLNMQAAADRAARVQRH